MTPMEGQVPQTIQDMFVGTWKLAGLAGEGALIDRLGTNAVGVLVYDNSGYMSVQIMNRERGTVPLVTLEDFKEAFQSYIAYFGKYSIDVKERTITHDVIGSLSPGDVGRKFERLYEFTSDGLVLTANGIIAGEHIAAQLIWQRAGQVS